MKLITLKPLLLGGKIVVEGNSFETHEQHGQELIAKGYARTDETDAEPVVTIEEELGSHSLALTSDQLSLMSDSQTAQAPAGKAARSKKKVS
ncbi:hypothetical protein [Pseudomonas sp. HMWF021]|uniref:DUF7210 family protein n=1 Tax=Pseudomonas sp. HMWF021 TaxID=2056857 RepID=UPI0021158976|nr:hypothetical protein [Pseudomonas sp. HMWF021]